ncbi:autophagy-related protein [Salix suchowensis]|nr:autophagy-related protein [Salix suchowensis]
MRKSIISSDVQKQQQKNLQGRVNGNKNGFLPSSFRAISSYLRIVSSGASTVARSAASAAQSIADRDDDANHDQVRWAGFDKLEGDDGVIRHVLLLGYQSGFEVWDVEEANNVRDLVSRHDGPVSFLQMLPKPVTSEGSKDKFEHNRPLLVVCSDGAQDGPATSCNGNVSNNHDPVNGSTVPIVVRFYSLRSQSYVHVLKFRSAVYSVRCSSRIVAISQSAQIHCFNATTLEREYTILTNPMVMGSPASGGIGYGPLAVGPRWLAYSGSPVVAPNSGRVSPQHLTSSMSFSGFTSNGSLVAHYAKESSKQLASGIVTLGDMGYKKLSRYCSELLPDPHGSLQSGNPGWKSNGTVNGHFPDADNIGMVVVRDIVSKVAIAQFRAHKSPISAFDASVQGHNINVFKIMPGLQGSSSAGGAGASYVHLYRLQRGFTNAVIQDISFSDDSYWIMISSSRGTSHLFAINPSGGAVNFQSSESSYVSKHGGVGGMNRPTVSRPPCLGLQMHNQQSLCATGPTVTLSAVSRIRSGNNGWRGTVTGAAAAATGRLGSLSGAIASSFHKCKGNYDMYGDGASFKSKYHLLLFSPSGSMIQYTLRILDGVDSTTVGSGLNVNYESAAENVGRLVVEAMQKWNICQKQHRRDLEDNVDIYGDNGNSDSNKIHPEGIKKGNSKYPEDRGAVTNTKISPEEKHHLYISEAELHVHQARLPLWAKPEIYFQSMMTEGIDVNDADAMQGEIEIERIPARMIEARSKDLVPLFDYLQTPKFPHSRLSCRSSSGSLDSMAENGAEETGWNGSTMPVETRGSVHSNGSPKTNTRLEVVNSRESSRMEAQLKFVNNNNNEGPKTENHFEDEGDEFD